jgi:signal transduction histidine kinase/DNA-binding response OmpR family regulator
MVIVMNKKPKRNGKGSLLFSIILVFCILGAVVFSVARKTSREMSESAINNLSDSLALVKGTIEAILVKEAEFQDFIAQEIAVSRDPYGFIRSYNKNHTITRVSLIMEGETEGISNTGEPFTENDLDFSFGKRVGTMPLTQSYLNDMGTWAYTMKCPVIKDGKEMAALYIEHTIDSFEMILPDDLYDGKAMLYVMDSKSERLVLKPTGMGERDAGHLNLADFYRANNIMDEKLQAKVAQTIRDGENIMFYHDIRNKNSLIYMWGVNDGAFYLIGYVPIEAIQQEGRSVNQNILIVVIVMLIAFFLCCILYFFSQKQQEAIRKEQEAEREIYNKQLAEALHAAQIASNSKTTFLSNMSHDIRTPMNAILGFTTLLSRDADNPVKVREYTKKITSSGQHLLSLINDVLDVSKIESGKMVLTIGEFTLNDLVSSVDAIIRPMAREKNQIYHVTVTDIHHEYLIGDETRINQVLINLLSNSVKYTPAGGNIWFRIIGQKQRSAQYEYIRIEVEDDGYGMTPEFLETIFDAFTRAENSTTNKVQGAGLGMAITKNIVELMGGTIEVFSEVNKGTLFKVDLELRIPSKQSDEQFWTESGITRVLAMDESADTCKSIELLMKDIGITADTALSSQEALEMARHAVDNGECYQAVLLEADMDGAKTAEKLREIIPEAVPILFLTSCESDDAHREASPAENTGYLMKPFFVSAFKEALLGIRLSADNHRPEASPEEDVLLKGMHFLVAEDNDINAEILSELLDMEGAACEIAENGQLVLERFERAAVGEFDAILMDVQMPVMNGYEAAAKIRLLKRPDAGSIPIIAMTANAFAEDVKDALNAGMNAHVAKPINMDILKKTICQYIS